MEEKLIMKGKLKDAKTACMTLPVIGLLLYVLNGIVAAKGYAGRGSEKTLEEMLSYGFGTGNGANFVFLPLIFVLVIVGVVMYKRWSKVQITVTDKRVYGYDAMGKRVDLPLDSITAVGTSMFNGLAVTTASGAIKFVMLKNRDELHEVISKLLVNRQDKPAVATVKQEIPQSNADELKKYKDLYDSGVISKEEFDAKKKQLLDL